MLLLGINYEINNEQENVVKSLYSISCLTVISS